MAKSKGTITGTGTTTPVLLGESFSLSLRDFGTATIALERSLGDGEWGSIEVFTTDIEKEGEGTGFLLYRLNCTAYTSGTIKFTLQD